MTDKTIQIKNTSDLLNFFITQSSDGEKNWFGFHEQKLVKMNLAFEMAKLHAPNMTPTEVVDYVNELNNKIYNNIVKKESK